MGKNQSASNLTNIIKQDASGNIVFTSGSTTLATISTAGQLSGSTAVLSAQTASFVQNAQSASYVLTAQTASFVANAQTASFVALAQSASNAVSAATASFANAFTVAGTLTAQTLVVQTITSSIDFVTGSTRFGSILGNTHQFTGSVSMTGSLAVVTNGTEFQVTSTGVNFGNIIGDAHNITGSVLVSGSFGLNKAVPQRQYTQVANANGIVFAIQNAAASNEGYIVGFDATGSTYLQLSDSANAAKVYLNSSGSSYFTGGSVGIGTTSPYTKHQIQGGHASIQSNSTASTDGAGDTRNAGFGFRHASANLISALINTTAVADWGLNLHFNTRQFNATMPATPAMTITAGQNVGIGTSTPEGPLHINGAVGAGYIGMAISNYANNIGTTSGIDFGTDMSTCYNGNGNGQISVTNTDGTTMKSEMNLKIWNGSTVVTGIKISDAGRVSFPTTTAQNYGLSNSTATTISAGASGTVASCSITSVGKPILVNVTGDINPISGPSWCYIYIYRNGSPVGKYIIAESPGASANVPFALSTIDIPGAGTHTYTGYITVGGSNSIQFGETGNGQAPTVLAIELL